MKRSSVALYAALVVATFVVVVAAARLWQNVRVIELLSALPQRECQLFDANAKRIRLPVKNSESPENLTWRHLIEGIRVPQVRSAVVTGRTGRSAIKPLGELTELNRLTIISVSIDERLIEELQLHKHLRELQFVDCIENEAQLREIRRRLPRCTVIGDNNQGLRDNARRQLDSQRTTLECDDS